MYRISLAHRKDSLEYLVVLPSDEKINVVKTIVTTGTTVDRCVDTMFILKNEVTRCTDE